MNLNLRKRVAEANGCKAVIRTINNLAGIDNTYLFCECEGEKRFNSHSEWVNGKLLIKPYDLDHHAALDALMEFCNKESRDWRIEYFGSECRVMIFRQADRLSGRYFCVENKSLAPAICKAIKAAAQKSEKEGVK